MSDDREEVRTSLYLVRRAEALLGTLKFFSNPSGNPVGRRLVFLAQVDFWEWEMENLIYSFTNFAERSLTWQSPEHVKEKLWALGVVADEKLSGRVRWRRGMWRVREEGRRVAPAELLAETVDAWNTLVDQAETHFIRPVREKMLRYNIQGLTSLQHLKKKMPELEMAQDEP
jgi:Cu2+-containing amine oxidase